MNPAETALLLIGYQNDYFASDGILAEVVQDGGPPAALLARTVALVAALRETSVTIVATPIVFTSDYRELLNPVGVLRAIRDAGAFREGSPGAETVPELRAFGDRVTYVPGKRGLNAFSNTALDALLERRGVKNLILAGVVTSICIDSTARAAVDRGFAVSVVRDCTGARTAFEHEFYCDRVLPLYASVVAADDLVAALARADAPDRARA